ncbi:12059_t:CDS:2 [Funneliformis caledonium]|uniref:12059_t:CDS:1 n=1 Tax=Funneliformis caledonium TaxID=1117310 RepID=A0A9N9NC35_9GLOM|nr:12059_t:CDS:2 [Funneliformis caledonium]
MRHLIYPPSVGMNEDSFHAFWDADRNICPDMVILVRNVALYESKPVNIRSSEVKSEMICECRILPTIVNLCLARDTPDFITLLRPNGTIFNLEPLRKPGNLNELLKALICMLTCLKGIKPKPIMHSGQILFIIIKNTKKFIIDNATLGSDNTAIESS